MSSSISSSETALAGAGVWRRFTVTLVAASAAVMVGLLALIYAVDPFDSGRSSLFAKPGVRPQGPRTANASRGRDPAYDALIVGNSRIQLISPERLKRATGFSFVQLATPATGPKEHLTLVEWYLRHHKNPPKAIIMGLEDSWCTSDPELTPNKPFPFWLYSADLFEYGRGLLRYDLLEELPRRIGYLVGKKSERARPDGYWDYEPEYIGQGFLTKAAARERLQRPLYPEGPRYERDPKEGQRIFPAVDRLRRLAAALPEETPLILVIPPVFKTAIPMEGTEKAFNIEACKAAIKSVAESRRKTALIDRRIDRPDNRQPEHYFDYTHYRQPIARSVEADILEALRKIP